MPSTLHPVEILFLMHLRVESAVAFYLLPIDHIGLGPIDDFNWLSPLILLELKADDIVVLLH